MLEIPTLTLFCLYFLGNIGYRIPTDRKQEVNIMAVKRARIAYIAYSAGLMILGIVLMCINQTSVKVIANTIGIIVTLCGVAKCILYFVDDMYGLAFQFDFAQGIFFTIVGIVLLVKPVQTIEFINVVVGIFVIADGSCKLQTAGEAKKFGMRCWKFILGLAVLTTVAGILLVLSFISDSPVMFTGIALLLDGIENLYVAAFTIKLVRRVKGVEKDD